MEIFIKEKSEVLRLGNVVVVFEIVQGGPYDRFKKSSDTNSSKTFMSSSIF